MLEAVGHAAVVNPDAELFELARERGWEVLRLDRLGRKLLIAGGITVASLGGAVGVVVARLLGASRIVEEPPPRRLLPRLR